MACPSSFSFIYISVAQPFIATVMVALLGLATLVLPNLIWKGEHTILPDGYLMAMMSTCPESVALLSSNVSLMKFIYLIYTFLFLLFLLLI